MTLPRLRSADLPLPLRWSLRLMAAVGSLQLAVALIAVYVCVLAWATTIESKQGAAAAHVGIYDPGVHGDQRAAGRQCCAALIRLPEAAADGLHRDPRRHPCAVGRCP